MADISKLDETLAVLVKYNVESCGLINGEVVNVKFKATGPYGVTNLFGVDRTPHAANEELQLSPADSTNPYKDELLELALNPPSDIRHPVDNGKD